MAESTIGLLRVVLSSNSAQFTTEMGKASTSVSGFDKTAQQAAKSLASMVSSFNGTKAAAEAQKVAQAVTQVGGASKLTEGELNRVRATLDATISKFNTLGTAVPADIAKVRAEITQLDQAAGRTAGTGALGGIARVLPGLSVAGLVAGVTALGKASLDSAGQIIDLKNKTGLSTDAIQEMQAVANQTGTSLEAFTNSAFKLGVNIAAGTTKAKEAVDDLGLSYAALKAAKPEEQFAMIVRALEGVDNQQERNRLGVALFGKQFAEIAAAVEDGYSGIADSATKSTEAQLRALDKAADKWDEFKTNFQTGFRSMAGTLVQGISDVERAADSLSIAQKATLFAKGGGNPAAYLAALKEMGVGLRESEDAVKAATDAFNKLPPNVAAATSATASYSAQLRQAMADVAGLSAAQRTELNAALKLGGDAAKDYAESIGLSESALSLYQSGVKDSAKSTKELAAEKEKAAAAALKFAESVKAVHFRMVPFSTAVQDGSVALRNLASGLNANGTLITKTKEEIAEAAKATAEWVRQNGMLKGSIEQVTPAMLTAGEATEGFFQKVFGSSQDLGQNISGIFQAAFQGGGGALGAVKSFATQTLSTLMNMIPGIGPFISGFAGPIVAMFGKLAGKAKDFFKNLFGGDSEHEKVNDLRDDFTSAAGGIHELNVKAQAAGLTLDRFLKAKTVKEYEAAIAELEAAFGRLDERRESASDLFDEIMDAGRNGIPESLRPTIDKFKELGLLTKEQIEQLDALGGAAGPSLAELESAASALGAKLETLGPAFAQQKLDQEAGKVHEAITRLISAGGDWGSTMMASKEELGSLVSTAKKGHLTLSESLRPFIEDLMATGNLIGENGEKITDLSGINWGPEMKSEAQVAKEGWDRIIAAIESLITKITGPLATALDDVTRDRTINITPKVGEVDIDKRFRDPDNAHTNDPGFASGTMGRVGSWFKDFGSRFPTALHGVEAVLRPQDALPFARSVLGNIATLEGGTTNSIAVLPVIMGGGMSSRDIGRQAARYLSSSGLPNDEAGITSAFEAVIDNWMRTYRG
jgi:hypothetical protein